MSRGFSVLLLTFGVMAAVSFMTDAILTGDANATARVRRFIDLTEIPEYEILFWPESSSSSRKSSKKTVQAVVIESPLSNITATKKKKKHEVVIGITSRPIGEGRITVRPGPEIIAVPVTVKPNSATTKPQVTSTVKAQVSTVKSKTTPKPVATTSKKQILTNAAAQQNKVTAKPATTQTVKPIIRNVTVSNLQVNQVTPSPIKATTKKPKPNKQKPEESSSGLCNCVLGICTCCSGPLLGLLSQKACIKVIYIPEDFAFDYSLMLNNRVLYQNKISGKNPRPACIGIPRFNRIKLCARFSNVYFAGRNVHFCMGLEGRWDYEELFTLPFDCVRMGAQGFAIVKPEEGGGIDIPGGVDSIIDAGGDDIGEYDENVVRTLLYY